MASPGLLGFQDAVVAFLILSMKTIGQTTISIL